MTDNLPPGLKHLLFYYFTKPWVKLGQPILLFEHLQRTYGSIAHYRFMGTSIVFVNDPEYIREVLINQAPTFRVENMPYGGVKDSGFGREGVRYTMEEMTELKALIIKRT